MKFNSTNLFIAQKQNIITQEKFLSLMNFFTTNEQILDDKNLLLAQQEDILTQKEYFELLHFLIENEEKTETLNQEHLQIDTNDTKKTPKSKLNTENLLYYIGGMIIIIAMFFSLGNVWAHAGKINLLLLSMCYCGIFAFFGNILWKKGLKTPGGILFCASLSLVPFIVYSFESIIGIFHPGIEYGDINKTTNILHRRIGVAHIGWVVVEVVTIAVGLFILKYRKFPPITGFIGYTAWYLSMDIVPVLTGDLRPPTGDERQWSSLMFGLVMLLIAIVNDKREKGENLFHYFYKFSAILIFCSSIYIILNTFYLNVYSHSSFLSWMILGVIYMVTSILVQEKIFMILGVISFFIPLLFFIDEPFFPAIAIVSGLFMITAGIFYQKNKHKITKKVEDLCPEFIKAHLPRFRN